MLSEVYLEQIVEVMSSNRPDHLDKSSDYIGWATIVRDLADAFQAINPNFDAEQFQIDCGIAVP